MALRLSQKKRLLDFCGRVGEGVHQATQDRADTPIA
jgi:hypothetical protein